MPAWLESMYPAHLWNLMCIGIMHVFYKLFENVNLGVIIALSMLLNIWGIMCELVVDYTVAMHTFNSNLMLVFDRLCVFTNFIRVSDQCSHVFCE